ncbi:Rap1a/Tai family immunity protein [Phaeobacter inhibens]|uniref:Rap1a/Tai family immunity protein n=1 Tax=Phaeobacter inhibens TaxID=221822 RepID=UPI000CA2A536|nr:Rap1a/Tai family immunity protein [Phaeobacter inhibens]AUQ53181.1 hypothetical protein PhaeoP92_00475 [Phaeobacter inhibens]AUQ77198.1 hypothetical protein PhaeoP74_00477 [Phaeobacter inhibens]AUR14357.1 hypothetical protein PhaeoP70_00475 [Phaeobacter inhibens]WHP69116.1 Rap1a/Tai family immunity protein [Phaeobacter inhibens]
MRFSVRALIAPALLGVCATPVAAVTLEQILRACAWEDGSEIKAYCFGYIQGAIDSAMAERIRVATSATEGGPQTRKELEAAIGLCIPDEVTDADLALLVVSELSRPDGNVSGFPSAILLDAIEKEYPCAAEQ